MKKRYGFVVFFLFVFFAVSYSQTPIPKTFEFLYVNPCLSGGVVISNKTFNKDIKDCIVRENGKTFVRLLKGSVYIIQIGDKYFYPNGDYCPYGANGRAIYLGDKKWFNTCYSNSLIKIIGYTVIWPPN